MFCFSVIINLTWTLLCKPNRCTHEHTHTTYNTYVQSWNIILNLIWLYYSNHFVAGWHLSKPNTPTECRCSAWSSLVPVSVLSSIAVSVSSNVCCCHCQWWSLLLLMSVIIFVAVSGCVIMSVVSYNSCCNASSLLNPSSVLLGLS